MTRHRWLALAFAVSVLFCHGLFGASHIVASSPTPDVTTAAPVHESHEAHGSHDSVHMQHGDAGTEHDLHDSHTGMSDGSYFAAFFVALLWSLILLLRPAARVLSEIHGVSSHAGFAYPGSVSPPGRPTPQLLQVFRL